MSKISFYCFLVAITFSSNLYADSMIEKIKAGAISVSKSIIGEERTNQIFGLDENEEAEINLPEIPKLKKNATSTETYKIKEDKQAKSKAVPSKDREKYDYLFIREIFSVTRNRLPTGEEYSKWMNVLGQGGTREGVYRATVLDKSYAMLESDRGYPVNSQMIDFFVEYFQKYLDKKTSPKQITGWNMYSVKRIATEKTLEVIDLLKVKGDDLYDWYAVFSSDLASRWPDAWKSKIRKEMDSHVHKRWAKAVPEQHVKSEIMIKLHRVFNYLYNQKTKDKS